MQWILVSLILIRWIVIYPLDSAIQRSNNEGLIANRHFYLNILTINDPRLVFKV